MRNWSIFVAILLLSVLANGFVVATFSDQELESTSQVSASASGTTGQDIAVLGWGNQSQFPGSSTDDTKHVLALDNHTVIVNQQYSAILINGTTSTTNASTAVLIQIVDQNNSLVKHYHFGGSSSVHSVSEAFALIKKPTGGFAVSGCYRGVRHTLRTTDCLRMVPALVARASWFLSTIRLKLNSLKKCRHQVLALEMQTRGGTLSPMLQETSTFQAILGVVILKAVWSFTILITRVMSRNLLPFQPVAPTIWGTSMLQKSTQTVLGNGSALLGVQHLDQECLHR